MEYPFSDKLTYFKPGELRHLEKFLEDEPSTANIYTNARGESRQCMRVFLPMGIITQETVRGPMLRAGGRSYHTPRASEPGVVGKIIYKDDEGDHTCDSHEWLKWLGQKWTAEPHTIVKRPELGLAEKNEMIRKMNERSFDATAKPEKDTQWEKLGVKTEKPETK